MPKKIYQLTVTVEFEHGVDRSDWLENLKNNQPTNNLTPKLKSFTSKLLFEKCHLCGIERKRGTLGPGILGYPADECSPPHYASCQRRQEKNAQSVS
jgi:hypothetical protein